jgi:cyclic-di-AMP phosphodiesterase PgpH
MQAEPPSEPTEIPSSVGERAAWESWLARLPVVKDLSSRLTHLLLLLGVSVAAAFLISPGLYSQQIPQLGPEHVGKPFKSSPSGFKAGRDYDIRDDAKTASRREDARNNVLPVFDYDPSVQSGLTKSLQEAFGEMQALADDRPTGADGESSALEAPKTKPQGGKEKEAELTQRLVDNKRRFEQYLLPIDDEDFHELVAVRFSREVEQAAVVLLEHVYRAKVVSSRDELSRVDARGITVRILGGSSDYFSTSAPPSVLDIREAQAELDRFASVPGNLLADKPPMLRRAVLRLAKRQIRPNLTINIAETDSRRRHAAEAVPDAVISLKKGQKVIGDGELINESHLVVLNGMRAQTDELDLMQLQLGGTGLVGLLIAAAYGFHRAAFKRFRPTRKDALLLGLLLIGMLGVLHLGVMVGDAVHDRYSQVPIEALYYLIPVAAGAMLVRFVLNQELSLFFAIVLSCLTGVMLGNSLGFGVYTLISSLVASDRITRAKDRVGIFKAGVETGAVNLFGVLCFALAEGKGLTGDAFIGALFALIGTAVAVPMLVMALTPLIELTFGYASDIKLLELANLNHPALKELIVQAPGTYHHSIIIGSLVEAAAEAIGANPLLARSCAYYHDIGKGRNPLYFGENQKGENRHDSLAPAMSAVIIKRHVTEGLEMARQYKLPKLVADAIPQHHGTRLVGYFFHKAVKEQEGKESPQPIDESIYRYAGPKPQFREAALVMIADAVEAASRSMPEPTTSKLQALVQKLINMIFSEGQLDECDLTLKDLNLIAHSFVHTLEGIYHARPAYPPGAFNTGRPGGAAEPVKPALAVAKPAEGVKGDAKRPAGT